MTTLLILSDLHLADGDRVLDHWKHRQQDAFQSLLRLTEAGGPFDDSQVELVLNGDTFDFLIAQPGLELSQTTNISFAHTKLSNIIAAHRDWFAALQEFLRSPSHKITFLIGNHDLELWYPSIRAKVRSALHALPGQVRFSLSQAYQPHPQILIEHGCQYDPVNRVLNIWDQLPRASTPVQLDSHDGRSIPVGPIPLSWGSLFYYHVMKHIKQKMPYIDMMIPDFSPIHYVALACLLHPQLAIDAGMQLSDLLPSTPYVKPENATAENPFLLFQSLRDLFYATAPFLTDAPNEPLDPSILAELTMELETMDEMLKLDRENALYQILSHVSTTGRPDESFTARWAEASPDAVFNIAGHTHHEGRYALSARRTLVNTGTWIQRYVRPHNQTYDPSLLKWVMDTEQNTYPYTDGTRFPVAWVKFSQFEGPSVELIEIAGDSYRQIDDMALMQMN